MHKMFGF